MLLHKEITSEIINAFYKVYNTLGYGFLEKVYENGLALELEKRGIKVEKQVPIQVYYENKIVGKYFADLLVTDAVVVELKAAEQLIAAHETQLINYLKATEIEVGLLLNFGKEAKYKRRVLSQRNRKLKSL
ncbi:MAG: GxxExxY protein [Anaerolineae bacterium]|jgi:GxxExxY protein|nr:GxxExxY protein [Anaerolineae bacterium]MBT7188825.1 GxxExxY protein [Anaerolineae bacterium]MBT7989866.1 GxxExxY protein [Anaerolineae bacterium]